MEIISFRLWNQVLNGKSLLAALITNRKTSNEELTVKYKAETYNVKLVALFRKDSMHVTGPCAA